VASRAGDLPEQKKNRNLIGEKNTANQ